ncbi:hypothetical protein V8E36_003869 [Tilletia maclaganii]
MPGRVLIVLAPLIILIEEIARSVGEEATYLHAENRTPTLLADIKALKFKVVVTSPEMAASNAFREILKEPAFQGRLGAIILDECQVVKDWAVDTAFRRGLKDVSIIRHMADVPGLAMSGTLPAAYRKEVLNYFELNEPVIVDIGFDSPNIKLTVAPIRWPLKSFLDVLAWLPELHGPPPEKEDENEDFLRVCRPTIIYVNNKSIQLDMYYAVDSWYSRMGVKAAVLLVSAEMSVSHRRRIKAMVEGGTVKCIVSTSALGMGSDMRKITRIIQWRVADSLAAVMQRIGRGGRDPASLADGIVLVDPWAVPRESVGAGSSAEADDTAAAAALLAAEAAGGIDDKSNKKVKIDVELMQIIHRALTKQGCVRAFVNSLLGQPPADKVPPPEQIFGSDLGAEERSRAGIGKLTDFIAPKLREWRLQMWRDDWSKDEEAPSWRGISYFLGIDDVAAVLKNLGRIDKDLSAGEDVRLGDVVKAEAQLITAPKLLAWLKEQISTFDALQRALDKAKKKEDAAEAAKAGGKATRVNHCKKCVEWNKSNAASRHPSAGFNQCPSKVAKELNLSDNHSSGTGASAEASTSASASTTN